MKDLKACVVIVLTILVVIAAGYSASYQPIRIPAVERVLTEVESTILDAKRDAGNRRCEAYVKRVGELFPSK